jgi:flagellar hook capping protein FlgD
MRVRHLALPTLIAAVIALGTLTAPASAAEAPPFEVSAIDTSTPGHARGTVTTDAAYVRTQLFNADMGVVTGATFRPVSADTRGASFDYQTWGLEDGSFVTVRACTGAADYTCGPESTVEFTPSNVAPEVTWSEVDKVSPDNPPYVITVSDPQGDGSTLMAFFRTGRETVNRSGDTTLTLPGQDGTGQIEIWRCGTPSYCVPTGVVSPEITARRRLWAVATLSTSGPLRPDADEKPDATMSVSTELAGDYTLDWWVEATNGTPLPGVGETGIPVTLGALTPHALPIDLTGLTSGTRYVRVRLTGDFDGFGELSGVSSRDDGWLVVDVTPPAGAVSVSSKSLYPYRDGYQDTVAVDLGVTNERVDAQLEVLDDEGQMVKKFHESQSLGEFTWDGRVTGGGDAPAGNYTFRATLTDDLGNAAVYEGGPVTVSSKKLVTRTFRKTVTAAGSMQDKSIGRCSVLKRPSARGWAGSFGYYTNTKCDGTWDKSVVVTMHAVKVPAAHSYGTFNVSTYGGAAKSRPGSYLFLDQLTKKGTWGDKDTRLGYQLGAHRGPTHQAAAYLYGGRSLVWSVYTGLGAAYDVKGFTVTMSYQVLV